MTKAQLLKRFKTCEAIGLLFKPALTRQAVQLWPMDQPIPKLRVLELRRDRPDLFRRRA